MNKKGFTLVELLAVIAIMAILMLLIMPNVLKMFNQGKRNAFKVQIESLVKTAEMQRQSDLISGKEVNKYCLGVDSSCINKLNLNDGDIKYMLIFGSNNKVNYVAASDSNYCYVLSGDNIDVNADNFNEGGTLTCLGDNCSCVGGKNASSESLSTVFSYEGPCIFNGESGSVTGSNCSKYVGQKLIDTGINLYGSDYYKKDYIVEFTIDEYNSSAQEVAQATLFNVYSENSSIGNYGTFLRRSSNRYSLVSRDGNGASTNQSIVPKDGMTITIVKKKGIVCYKTDKSSNTYNVLLDMTGFTNPFEVPATFGGSINASGDPFRSINGTLSNMSIKVGTIGDDIVCKVEE